MSEEETSAVRNAVTLTVLANVLNEYPFVWAELKEYNPVLHDLPEEI